MGNSTAKNARMAERLCLHPPYSDTASDPAKVISIIQKDPKVAKFVFEDVSICFAICIYICIYSLLFLLYTICIHAYVLCVHIYK